MQEDRVYSNSDRLFLELQDKLESLQAQVGQLYTIQNLVLLLIGSILLIFLILSLLFLSLYSLHLLRTFIDKIGKRQHFIQISFDKYTNFHDTRYLQMMDNLYKRLEQIIRLGGNSISIETHKQNGIINFLVSCSDKKIIQILKSQLQTVEGFKVDDYQYKQDPIFEKSQLKYKKVFYKPDTQLINFKTQNVFLDIVRTLEQQDVDAGCILLLRSSRARRRLLGMKQHLDRLSKDPKRSDQFINQEKSRHIGDKISHGELLNARIYLYSRDHRQLDSLVSCFAQSNLSDELKHTRVFWPSELCDIQNRYIPPEFAPLRLVLGYSYLSSFELAHIFRPLYSDQMRLANQYLARLAPPESKDLLLLNESGDRITEEDAYNGIMVFGDTGSGKTSSFISNVISTYLQKDYGLLFTVYKAEEVPLILKLAQDNGKLDNIIRLNPETSWRTNIVNTELKASGGSINNVIEIFDILSDSVLKSDSSLKTGDPYWEKTAKVLFSNLVKLTIIFYDSFSFPVFNCLSELFIDYVRFTKNNSNSGKSNVKAREKKELFEHVLNHIGQSFKSSKKEIEDLIYYFTASFPSQPENTLESIYSVFRANLDIFSSGSMTKILLSDLPITDPNYFEISSTREGKIIILDQPVSSQGKEGLIFQKVFKQFWYLEMQRRKQGKPCALISDEFQVFSIKEDTSFLNINRSYNIALVSATQNRATLIDELGSAKTDRLLANSKVKVFFRSTDESTWQYARKTLGEVDSNNYSEQYNSSLSTSISSSQKFELLGEHFQRLGMNIPDNQAEAIIYNGGYKFNGSGKGYLQVLFEKTEKVVEQIDYNSEPVSTMQEIDPLDLVKSKLKKLSGDYKLKNVEKPQNNMVTVSEAAQATGISQRALREWVNIGRIKFEIRHVNNRPLTFVNLEEIRGKVSIKAKK